MQQHEGVFVKNRVKIVLFTEINSKLGSPFLRVLSAHPLVELKAVVTSPKDVLCNYFVNDTTQVDVETEAEALGVMVLRPDRVNAPEVIDALTDIGPDYLIVANFQQLLKSRLLATAGIAAINFHPSPLPRNAGLAPFYWIIRNGDRQSSISVIKMDEGLDTGPIIMQRQIPLREGETSLSLRTLQEEQNILMLLELIPLLASGSFTCMPQDLKQRTYFGLPAEDDYFLDFSLSAKSVLNQIRAGYRYPGSYFFLEDGTRVVVLTAALATDHPMQGPGIPGGVVHTSRGTFISTADGWLQLLTVDVQGVEAPVSAINLPGMVLDTSEISADAVLPVNSDTHRPGIQPLI